MQGVSLVAGEVCSSSVVAATAASTTSSLASPKSGSSLQGSRSFFIGGKAGQSLQAVSSSGSSEISPMATGKGVQVQSTPRSMWNWMGAATKKVEATAATVEYDGVAAISRKRGAISNLVKFDIIDPNAAVQDRLAELLGQKIVMQLVSVDLDPKTNQAKVSDKAELEEWLSSGALDVVSDVNFYSIKFKVPSDFGAIGAVIIRNNHPNEFYIKSLSLSAGNSADNVVEFATNAWIYPKDKYPKDRVFFTNKPYLPSATPAGLIALREQELEQIRGPGTGERQDWERIYDYDIYNDLGNPDLEASLARIPLGGSKEYPYPRRMRTGRGPAAKDPKSEKRMLNPLKLAYIPSDEYFLRTKDSTFIAALIKGVVHSVFPGLRKVVDATKNFDSYKDIFDLYTNGLPIEQDPSIASSPLTPDLSAERGDLVYLSTIFAAKGSDTNVLNYPVPKVVHKDQVSWMTDEEFGREAIGGLHSSVISRVQTFPPKSTLDPAVYGEGTALTDAHILPYLEGLTVAKAIEGKKLFTVDYRDALLSTMSKVNADSAGFKGYATRTIFFLNGAGKLLPVAIELSLPPAQAGGAASNRVFTPADAKDHLWDLAKIHASAIDSNYHEVISHFTYCHAVMEPFIIASNRQLSEMHPIKTLLKPYFKDTLSINAAARDVLINADGIVEANFTLGRFTFPLAAQYYGAFWQFNTQAINDNLVHRGMAEPADSSHPGSVKLVLEDYPWAKDGLDLFDAIYKWVSNYIEIIYEGSDDAVKGDTELQAWWKELVNVGHGDLKDATWWPKLDSTKNLVHIVSTIAWIAGPTHAALNFNQYDYAGYPPNKPSCTRQFVPEKGSAEYEQLQKDPEKFTMLTIPTLRQATQVMTIIEVLATHSVDEEYVGTRNSTNWTSDSKIKDAFRDFADKVVEAEELMKQRNLDPALINRSGPVDLKYSSFMPSSTSGMTGRGVPNSVSI